MQPPPTRYARADGAAGAGAGDGVSIAYQVVGDGPMDLLLAPGFISHLDLSWTDPGLARFFARLASFSRLILYDKPGTGLSDPIPNVPTLEERAADILAVLDAAQSQEAAILAFSEGGPASLLTAATHPDRIRALVLYGSFALLNPALATPEERAELPADALEEALRLNAAMEDVLDHWGEGRAARLFAPSITSEVQRRFYATFERAAASPRMARALVEAVRHIDARAILPAIRCPTLVLHRRDDTFVPFIAGEMLARRLPNGQLVELEGEDHAFWFGDFDPIVDEIERFLTGTLASSAPDRVLASILFTDMVGSTERAAELGDAEWRGVLERHDALVSEVVRAHGGRVVKHIGDGALSSFGGPAKAVRCAQELCERARDLGIELRAGVHTGECEAIGDDLGGLAVHIGARVAAQAGAGEVVVSGTVKDLVVGSDIRFADRGEHELKGVPGTWRLYTLDAERAPAPTAEPLDSAAEHMTAADRAAVALARRAPRVMRFGARVASRGA